MNQDFRDLLHELSEANARFLVVGAFALAAHGLPRATGDIDVWVEPTAHNAGLVYAALVAFGAPLEKLTIEDLSSPDVVFQMGLPPRRIDILTSIDGVKFEDAWKNRKLALFADIEVPVLGAADFVTNKRATGRARDLVDADTLEALLE